MNSKSVPLFRSQLRCHSFSATFVTIMTNHDNWLGYLAYMMIEETVKQSTECCSGCMDNKSSALMHSHHHSGLFEKLHLFLPSVKDVLISKIATLIADYTEKFPDHDLYDEVGQRILRTFGKDFIAQSNPLSLYYTNYVSAEIDQKCENMPAIKVKPMTLKRVKAKIVTKDGGIRKRKNANK